MSITYPLDMPTDVIGVSSISLRARNAVGVTESPFTYRQQVFRHAGQAWAATIGLAPVNREFAEPWVAFLLALEGPSGTFLLGDPLGACPRGVISPNLSLAVDGGAAAGAQSFSVQGFSPISTSGVLLPGDYIQLGSGATATLHKVLLPVSSDAGGLGTVHVWPRPRRALNDGETVVYSNPRGRFRLAPGEQTWDIASNLRYGVQFDAVEAL